MSPYEYWINPILGDVNKDINVDYRDLSQLAAAYSSISENSNCDLNGDDKVDASDLFTLSKNFGKTV